MATIHTCIPSVYTSKEKVSRFTTSQGVAVWMDKHEGVAASLYIYSRSTILYLNLEFYSHPISTQERDPRCNNKIYIFIQPGFTKARAFEKLSFATVLSVAPPPPFHPAASCFCIRVAIPRGRTKPYGRKLLNCASLLPRTELARPFHPFRSLLPFSALASMQACLSSTSLTIDRRLAQITSVLLAKSHSPNPVEADPPPAPVLHRLDLSPSRSSSRP